MASSRTHTYIFYPLLFNCVACSLLILVLSFTSRKSTVRPAVFLVVVILAYKTVRTNQTGNGRKSFAVLSTGSVLCTVLQYLDVVLLRQWTFGLHGTTSPKQAEDDFMMRSRTDKINDMSPKQVWERILFGFKTSFAYRYLGTPLEIENIPQFPSGDGGCHISKARFLFKTAVKLLVCLLILDASSFGARPENTVIFLPHRVPVLTRLKTVSCEELAVRLIVTLVSWLITYCVVQSIYCVHAICFVSCGLTDPATWPPVFGSLQDAWSVRQFWG